MQRDAVPARLAQGTRSDGCIALWPGVRRAMSAASQEFEFRSHGGGPVEEEHELSPLGLFRRFRVEFPEPLQLIVGALVEGDILLVAVHPWQERMVSAECFFSRQRFLPSVRETFQTLMEAQLPSLLVCIIVTLQRLAEVDLRQGRDRIRDQESGLCRLWDLRWRVRHGFATVAVPAMKSDDLWGRQLARQPV